MCQTTCDVSVIHRWAPCGLSAPAHLRAISELRAYFLQQAAEKRRKQVFDQMFGSSMCLMRGMDHSAKSDMQLFVAGDAGTKGSFAAATFPKAA